MRYAIAIIVSLGIVAASAVGIAHGMATSGGLPPWCTKRLGPSGPKAVLVCASLSAPHVAETTGPFARVAATGTFQTIGPPVPARLVYTLTLVNGAGKRAGDVPKTIPQAGGVQTRSVSLVCRAHRAFVTYVATLDFTLYAYGQRTWSGTTSRTARFRCA